MNSSNTMAASIDQITADLYDLKLTAMAESFRAIAFDPIYQNRTFEEKLAIMVRQEMASRTEKRQQRCLQRSRLRELPVWNQADEKEAIYSADRNLNPQEFRHLLSCEWISRGNNVMIEGATGTGKTWMLAVLGKQACLKMYSTLYLHYSDLLEQLADAREHNETASFRRNLGRFKLLIIDDFGTSSISNDKASDLLTVLAERESNSSIAIASQLPFSEWHGYLGGNRNADAIMDRLLNSSYKFELQGGSLRERQNKLK